MNQTGSSGEALGVGDTLTQMVNVLGFHDLSSFLMTSVFVIAAAALLISGGIVIVKKRRERRKELEAIVEEIQKPVLEQPIVKSVVETADVVSGKEPAVAQEIEPAHTMPVVPPVVEPVVQEAQPVVVQEVKPVVQEAQPVVQEAKPKVQKAKPVAQKTKPIAPKITPAAPVVAQTPAAPVVEPPATKAVPEPIVESKKDLGAALKNTREGFMGKLARLFSRGAAVSDDDFEEMESILFTADIGVKTAQKLLDVMRERAHKEKSIDKAFLRTVLKEEMTKILESAKKDEPSLHERPQVVMFVGVNGAGKTTSIGKLGAQLASHGKKVLFGAGDTFRAAAVEQLTVWGERVGAEVVSGKENSDSAAVLFEAIEKAKHNHVDYVLCDTAGRLHTKVSLMDELKKVHRVVSKAQTGAPHQVFLVIDATMGQNAINQAREFAAATPLTGVVLSKLDGTAKGGVALGIVDELKVPIRYIGIGERVSDLRDFDAKLFVDALFEEA